MKKSEKIAIIKWYIREKCACDSIQTLATTATELPELERMVREHRSVITHVCTCSSCWYGDRDYCSKCYDCKDGSNYTFPYGYWKRFYEQLN